MKGARFVEPRNRITVERLNRIRAALGSIAIQEAESRRQRAQARNAGVADQNAANSDFDLLRSFAREYMLAIQGVLNGLQNGKCFDIDASIRDSVQIGAIAVAIFVFGFTLLRFCLGV